MDDLVSLSKLYGPHQAVGSQIKVVYHRARGRTLFALVAQVDVYARLFQDLLGEPFLIGDFQGVSLLAPRERRATLVARL